MGKLFGTDGIRGVVNAGLDAELAYKVGLAAALVLSEEKRQSGGGKPLFTIGKDTRISGDLLKGALVAGLCSAGAESAAPSAFCAAGFLPRFFGAADAAGADFMTASKLPPLAKS